MSRTRRVARIAPHRAVARSGIALGVGTAAGLALSLRYSTAVAVLGGWNAGGLALLALAWMIILSCDARATGQRAAAEDPGRTAVTVLVLLASLAGVLAVTVLVRTPEAIAPKEQIELVALCLATVIVSWTLTHTAVTPAHRARARGAFLRLFDRDPRLHLEPGRGDGRLREVQTTSARTRSARASAAVSPGDSIPTRSMKPGRSSESTKSFSSGSPGARSFGRMPQPS